MQNILQDIRSCFLVFYGYSHKLSLIYFFVLCCSCGGIGKKKTSEKSSDPTQNESSTSDHSSDSQANADKAENDTNVENIPKSFSFREIQLDLEGDIRIVKVKQDQNGNFIIGLVADTPNTAGSELPLVQGFAVLKLDPSGKELWRYPTKEHSNSPLVSKYRYGSFHEGELVDLAPAPNGDVHIIALYHRGEKGMPGEEYANITSAAEMPRSESDFNGAVRTEHFFNKILMLRLKGGVQAESDLKLSNQSLYAAPVWWEPIGLDLDDQGNFWLSSSSSGDQTNIETVTINPGYVLQVQKINYDFTEVLGSTCFVSHNKMQPSGSQLLAPVATSASNLLVNMMYQPVPPVQHNHPHHPTPNEAEFYSFGIGVLFRDRGRCWDFFKNQLMDPINDHTHKSLKPAPLVNDSQMVFSVKSIKEVIEAKDASIDYRFFPEPENLRQLWGNIFEFHSRSSLYFSFINYLRFENSYVSWAADNRSLYLIANGREDLTGSSPLILYNIDPQNPGPRSINLPVNSTRKPASISSVISNNSQDHSAYFAWTEKRQVGEDFVGERSLHIVKYSHQKSAGIIPTHTEVYDAMAPSEFDHTGFSSVILSSHPKQGLTAFATIGSKSQPDNSDNPLMTSSTLLIGQYH